MKIIIEGNEKEIAALVLELQERHENEIKFKLFLGKEKINPCAFLTRTTRDGGNLYIYCRSNGNVQQNL